MSRLTEKEFKEACADYEHGYTMCAEYVCAGIGKTADELSLMYEDELREVFDIESRYVLNGITNFLSDLLDMTDPRNIHSVDLS